MYRIAYLTEADPSSLRFCNLGNYDIVCGYRCDFFSSNGFKVLFEKARRLIHLCLLEDIAYISAVTEILVSFSNIKDFFKLAVSILVDPHSILSANHIGYLAKLTTIVIGKRNVKGNAGTKTGVLSKESFHLFGITCKDDNNICTVVFHVASLNFA